MARRSIPQLSARDAAGVVADVLIPLVARGVILRRHRIEGLLDRFDADTRAARRLQHLRDRYGRGPVLLRLVRRDVVVVLAPEHVERVLTETPEPFAAATAEKRAALSHFQPHGVLISTGAARTERRRFNEDVLDAHASLHRLADEIVATISEEAEALLGRGSIDWPEFQPTWWRIVRRVVFGDAAGDDSALTDRLERLRAAANWAFAHPKRIALRDEFLGEIDRYLAGAEPGSLAELAVSARPDVRAADQIAHWLFAFDAAGMALVRVLALLSAHPEQRRRALEEVDEGELPPRELPFLRACVLESVRLWPTTPAILRETTEETYWENGNVPAHAAVLVLATFFHRDEGRLDDADRFAPDVWLGNGQPGAALVPFSAGPADCPGRNLVLLTTSTLLARLLSAGLRSSPAALDARRPLPRTLSPFRLRFARGPD